MTQNVVQTGDTVTLEFVGPGMHQKEPLDYEVTNPGANTGCWSSLLLGKRAGDTVTLPEREENEVYALIQRISRP